jgi:hypothetical protein
MWSRRFRHPAQNERAQERESGISRPRRIEQEQDQYFVRARIRAMSRDGAGTRVEKAVKSTSLSMARLVMYEHVH